MEENKGLRGVILYALTSLVSDIWIGTRRKRGASPTDVRGKDTQGREDGRVKGLRGSSLDLLLQGGPTGLEWSAAVRHQRRAMWCFILNGMGATGGL